MTDNLPAERDPWERLETETATEYAAFNEFCKLGPKRTLKMLASHIGVSYDTIKLYSKKNKWIDRSKALDIVANEILPTNIDMSPIETMAFQYAVGSAMLELGIKAINLKKPGTIKVSDAIKLIDKGAELQRKGQGLDQPGSVQININSKGFEAVKQMLDEEIEGHVIDED